MSGFNPPLRLKQSRLKAERPINKEGPPSRTTLPLSVGGSREPQSRSGRTDLRIRNDPGCEPHGPQVMTMRHWITSFRYLWRSRIYRAWGPLVRGWRVRSFLGVAAAALLVNTPASAGSFLAPGASPEAGFAGVWR